LLAVCQEFELEPGNAAIPKIASAFGGGIGNTGAVCGAVIGAVMAIGLKKERGDTMADLMKVAAVAQDFRARFEAEMGTINCRELTGVDLSTPDGMQQAANSNTAEEICFPAVGTAYQLVLDLLAENDPKSQ
jgi:C_GCAxxG_C_C family probable redox protein